MPKGYARAKMPAARSYQDDEETPLMPFHGALDGMKQQDLTVFALRSFGRKVDEALPLREQVAQVKHWARGERQAMEKESYEADKAKREREARVYGELADLIDRYSRPQQQPAQPGPQASLVAQPPTPEAAGSAVQDTSAALAGDDLDPADRGMEHVSTTMEDPRQPAAPRPGLARPQQPGPQAPEDRVSFSLYRNPNLFGNPKFLDDAAHLFLRAKMPQGVKWLERSYAAQRENAIEAIQLAMAGDFRAAETVFNRSGRRKVVPGTMKPTEDGKQVTVQFEDGASQTFDPRTMMRSFLSPREFFDLADREARAAETTRGRQRSEENYRERADAVRQGAEARAVLAACPSRLLTSSAGSPNWRVDDSGDGESRRCRSTDSGRAKVAAGVVRALRGTVLQPLRGGARAGCRAAGARIGMKTGKDQGKGKTAMMDTSVVVTSGDSRARPKPQEKALEPHVAALAAMMQRHRAEWQKHGALIREAIAKKDIKAAKRAKAGAEALRARQDEERTCLIVGLPGVREAIRQRYNAIEMATASIGSRKELPLLERAQAVYKLAHDLSGVIALERWLYGIDRGGATGDSK